GEIDGVEQLTRYLELLNRDTVLAPVAGIFAAQQIKPQARTLATDRGIRCVTLDYDAMRGMDSDEFRLFWHTGGMPRARTPPRRRRPLPPLPATRRIETGPDGFEYEVRPIAAARGPKTYRGPGGGQGIPS